MRKHPMVSGVSLNFVNQPENQRKHPFEKLASGFYEDHSQFTLVYIERKERFQVKLS